MMNQRNSHLLLAFLLVSVGPLFVCAQPALPAVVAGKVVRIASFQSVFITPRTVDVWLPPGYTKTKRYPVLYMHDGQMLFDPQQSWNKQAWDVDDAAEALLKSRSIQPFIVVGIWNGGATRHADYFPQKPFESLTQAQRDTVTAQLQKAGRTNAVFSPQADQYLRFIVEELKPFIDSVYAVKTDRAHTFIAGSSMGGLISWYALCEYPQVFGGAACLSTHWPGTFTLTNNPMPAAFVDYLHQHLPDSRNHKIYFDCGDQTLDALYPEIQKRVDQIMVQKGYTNRSWITRFYPGEDHSEAAWKKRLNEPLLFLMQK